MKTKPQKLTPEEARGLAEQLREHERDQRRAASLSRKKHHETQLRAANRLLAPHAMELVDRANGCWGVLCIRRDAPGSGGRYCEHWSDEGDRWSAFGTPYNGVYEALGRAMLLVSS